MLVFLLFFLLFSTGLAVPLNHTKREVTAGDPFELWIKGVQRTCFWSGTAPLCAGECPNTHFEVDRQSSVEIIKSCDVNLCQFENDPKFGDSCYLWTKKALCCI